MNGTWNELLMLPTVARSRAPPEPGIVAGGRACATSRPCDSREPVVKPTCTFQPFELSRAISAPAWTPKKFCSTRLAHELEAEATPTSGFGATTVVLTLVPLFVATWPPTSRVHTPPLAWSGWSARAPTTNALVCCERKAVEPFPRAPAMAPAVAAGTPATALILPMNTGAVATAVQFCAKAPLVPNSISATAAPAKCALVRVNRIELPDASLLMLAATICAPPHG